MSEEKTITIKKDTLWKVGTFVFAILFIIVLFNGGSFGGSGGGNVAVQPAGSGNTAGTTGSVKVPIEDNDPVLGDPDANIAIVEFSDFQCPFCARAHTGALSDMKNSNEFLNGEINLVYKHFPLTSIHPFAQKAGEAGECANRQGKFWEYHDTLFANQNALDTTSLKQYASQVGLDTNEFDSCLDNGDARSEVTKETSQATASGGRGTPFFVIINKDTGATQTVSGAVPWSNFESAINAVR